MTTHTLYTGPAGTGRLVITARPNAAGTPQAQWLVQFTRWGKNSKQLDQCAVWMPTLQDSECSHRRDAHRRFALSSKNDIES